MKELIGFPIGWLVGYLMGSFIYASFDIVTWDFIGRGVLTFVSTAWGAVLAVRLHFGGINE